MPPTIIHQFWSLIEITQTQILLSLDDASLVRWLAGQFQKQQRLNQDEACVLQDYINTRLPLIREIAEERRFLYQ